MVPRLPSRSAARRKKCATRSALPWAPSLVVAVRGKKGGHHEIPHQPYPRQRIVSVLEQLLLLPLGPRRGISRQGHDGLPGSDRLVERRLELVARQLDLLSGLPVEGHDLV